MSKHLCEEKEQLDQCSTVLHLHTVFVLDYRSYLILLQADCVGGQKSFIPVLDGQRQLLIKHLQVSLFTHVKDTRK